MTVAWHKVIFAVAVALACARPKSALAGPSAAPSPVRVYSTLLAPEEHPLYARRAVKPPPRAAFGPSGVGFMALRGFSVEPNGSLFNVTGELDRYSAANICTIVWPHETAVGAPNFPALAHELQRRGMGLMVGGFVPGGRAEYDVRRWLPRAEHVDAAKAMGPQYLGAGQSEQDIRYLWGYARGAVAMDTLQTSRFEAYRAFRRYSAGVEEDRCVARAGAGALAWLMGANLRCSPPYCASHACAVFSAEQLFVLARGVFTHYYLQTGFYTIAGAETSGGPPGQLAYSFIRGAGKQYGVLSFSNVCSFTRWGHKVPGNNNTNCTTGGDAGATCGTSYSTMARLMYTQLMYDAAATGFETYFFLPNGDRLSPVGEMQAGAKRFVDAVPMAERGVHVATTAFLLDYFAGWAVPCSDPAWPFATAWGQSPYQAPDYLADALFNLAYPGYRDASYYRDASREMSPTPYGDVFDVLLTDAALGVLSRYDTVFVAHQLTTARRIVASRLQAYAEQGGHLVMLWDSLADLGSPLLNVSANRHAGQCVTYAPGTISVRLHADGSVVPEPHSTVLCALDAPPGAEVLATALLPANHTAVAGLRVTTQAGGSLTVLAAGNYGVAATPLPPGPACQADQATASPRPLSAAVEAMSRDAFSRQTLFDVGGAATTLSWVPKRVRQGEYLVGVGNTALQQQPLNITARFGRVTAVESVNLTGLGHGQPGYLPHGFAGADIGSSSATTIAGADFRLLRLQVEEDKGAVEVVPHRVAAPAPSRVWFRIPSSAPSVREACLRRPSLRQLFDGVVLDWSYLARGGAAALADDGLWLGSMGLSLAVDLTSGIGVFPGMRLCNSTTSGQVYNDSLGVIRDVMAKLHAMGGRDAILVLHGVPELGPEAGVVQAEVRATVLLLLQEAQAFAPPLALHLRHSRKNGALLGPADAQWRYCQGLPGLRFAPNTGVAAAHSLQAAHIASMLQPGSLLLLDGVTALYSAMQRGPETAPLSASPPAQSALVHQYLSAARAANATVVLDAAYGSEDEEASDWVLLERMLAADAPPSPPPPSPSPPPGPCYQLGSPVSGLCTISGLNASRVIVSGCPPGPTGPCYSDYRLPSGAWAGAYGSHYDGAIHAADLARVRTSLQVTAAGKWNLSVELDGKTHAWAADPVDYLAASSVSSIECGGHAGPGKATTFTCVRSPLA